jgi:hypothetical protein
LYLHELRAYKKELEMRLLQAVAKELKWFEETTDGWSPRGVYIRMVETTTFDQEHATYILGNVEVELEEIMISDEQIAFVIKMARKHIREGKDPDWKVIRNTIRAKFYDDYHVDMLKRVYLAEKDNPMFKHVEQYDENFIDVNA